MPNINAGGYLGTPVATVAAGTAIDTKHQGTTIRAIVIDGGVTLVLREKDGTGAIKFQYTTAAGASAFVPIPLKFNDDVYSSATGALLYQ